MTRRDLRRGLSPAIWSGPDRARSGLRRMVPRPQAGRAAADHRRRLGQPHLAGRLWSTASATGCATARRASSTRSTLDTHASITQALLFQGRAKPSSASRRCREAAASSNITRPITFIQAVRESAAAAPLHDAIRLGVLDSASRPCREALISAQWPEKWIAVFGGSRCKDKEVIGPDTISGPDER